MLKPSYFYGKSDIVLKYYQELEDYLMKDIATFLLTSAKLGGKADRELFVLQQMGMTNDKIEKELKRLTNLSEKELKKILQDSVMTSFSSDKKILDKYFDGDFGPLDNPVIINVMNAEWLKCCGEIENLTRTTMAQHNADLVKLLNEAEIRVASGEESYSSATCEILDQYAKGGINVNYPTGSTRTLESAVRCAVVTSMNQIAAQVTNQYIVEGGIEYVIISAHLGARHDKKHPESLESHDWWQGKAFKINGSEEGFPNLLESTGYHIDTKTGQGTVVNPLGLHGYNCRHSHGLWEKDMKNPWMNDDGTPIIDPEESQEVYENQQKQRAMERSIRSSKRQLLVKQTEIDSFPEDSIDRANLQADYDRLAYNLSQKNALYKQYCKDKDLQTQADRLKVAGFGRKDASKANSRASTYSNNRVKSSIALSDFKSINGDGILNDDVVDYIYNTLDKTKTLSSYSSIEIISKKSNDVFITDVTQDGIWCKSKLQINSYMCGNKSLNELDKMFLSAKNTVCNSFYDAIIHETYHSTLAEKVNYSVYNRLHNTNGHKGISTTAAKDELETIAEIGVLYERGEFKSLSDESKKLFESYYEVKK